MGVIINSMEDCKICHKPCRSVYVNMSNGLSGHKDCINPDRREKYDMEAWDYKKENEKLKEENEKLRLRLHDFCSLVKRSGAMGEWSLLAEEAIKEMKQ